MGNGTYGVDDGNSNALARCLSVHDARRVAVQEANRLGEPVFLYRDGDDDQEEIRPTTYTMTEAEAVEYDSGDAKRLDEVRKEIRSRVAEGAEVYHPEGFVAFSG